MYFREWCEALQTGWRRLSSLLWPQEPQDRQRLNLARYDAELQRRQAVMLRLRRRIERLKARLERQDGTNVYCAQERLRSWEEVYKRKAEFFERLKQRRSAMQTS
jgi:hypothetical protein